MNAEFYVGSTNFLHGGNWATVYFEPFEMILKGKQQFFKCLFFNIELTTGAVYPAIKGFREDLTNEEIGQLYGGN